VRSRISGAPKGQTILPATQGIVGQALLTRNTPKKYSISFCLCKKSESLPAGRLPAKLMLDVLIENATYCDPKDRYLRRFSYTVHGGETREFLAEKLERSGVTAKSHPDAIDLFAGDGSGAKILEENGWKPENITCVDRCLPREPLVDNCHWKMWDLGAMIHELRLKREDSFPDEVKSKKGAFDVVFSLQPEYSIEENRIITGYFAKKDGMIITIP